MALTNQTIGAGGITGGTHTIQLQDTSQRVRFYDLAFLTEGAAGAGEFTTSRPGVLPGPSDANSSPPTAMACTATGTGLNIAVRPGAAVVERGTLVGTYVVAVYQAGQVTLATADPTNSRIDRVDLQVLDGALGDNGGTSLTRYVVTTGVASGSPAVPAAPINSIPLCQVLLPANTITLTNGMFTLKRKSAGLRGANRYLLEGDALSDPGYLVGERRMRLLAAYGGSPLVTDYWGSDGAWHGTNNLPMPVSSQAWQNGTSDITVSTTVYTDLVHVTIPDPGWAYVLKVAASCQVISASSWTPGGAPATQLRISLGSSTGTKIAEGQGFGFESSPASGYPAAITKASSGTLTGAQTVVFSVKNLASGIGGTQTVQYGGFVGNGSAANLLTWLDIDVDPVS